MNSRPLVKDQVIEHLRKHILSLRSDEPVRIESERDLAENLGVSRVSIRSAIKALCEEGLLSQVKGSGTYITPKISFASINLIVSNDIKYNDPFYIKLISELNSMCAKLSITLNLIDFNCNWDVSHRDTSIAVFIGHGKQEIIDALVSTFSKVIILCDNLDNENVTQISYDDFNIGVRAAELLIQNRHKKILMLSGPEKYSSPHYRHMGFAAGAASQNLVFDVITHKMNWSGGFECASLFLERYQDADTRPTGVFAANDWMAIGFIQGLKESGITVPGEVSVIGCDDIPLATEYLPQLSTFNLDVKLIVEELYFMLNSKEKTSLKVNRKVLLYAKFINRKTLSSPTTIE